MRDFATIIHYPSYNELPDELVFIDEIVELVNEVHGPLPRRLRNNKDAFTTAMARNYVKSKLTKPAIGKKYDREHAARILFASTIKLAFSADDTHELTCMLFDKHDCETVHNAIAAEFNKRLNALPEILPVNSNDPTQVVCGTVVLKFASLSMFETDQQQGLLQKTQRGVGLV